MKLESELLYVYMICDLSLRPLHILHRHQKKNNIKELSIILLTDGLNWTHLSLTINLISTFCAQKISPSCTFWDKLTCSQPMSALKFLHVYYYKGNGLVLLLKAFFRHWSGFCRLLPRMDIDWSWKSWTNFSKFKSCAEKKYQWWWNLCHLLHDPLHDFSLKIILCSDIGTIMTSTQNW